MTVHKVKVDQTLHTIENHRGDPEEVIVQDHDVLREGKEHNHHLINIKRTKVVPDVDVQGPEHSLLKGEVVDQHQDMKSGMKEGKDHHLINIKRTI